MAQQLSGADLQNWDGFIPLPLTPVYGSASTFTYPADLTGILSAGDKIKVTNNGSVKYFYVLPPVTFSAGNSTVTLTGGSDYSLVNSGSPVMASLYYSKMATPTGFPQYFNYTPTYTNLTVGNGTHASRFSINGRTVSGSLGFTMGSTSVMGSNPTATLPVTASSNYKFSAYIGPLYMEDAGVAAYAAAIRMQDATKVLLDHYGIVSTNVTAAGTSATAPWTWGTSDFFSGTFSYEF
jgi:hypothetical protein